MPKIQACSRSARSLVSAMLMCIIAVIATGSSTADPVGGRSLDLHSCPSLFLLGVQGTSESSPDTPVSVDGGTLSAIFVPVVSAVGPAVAGRAYVPYQASFGGFVPGSRAPYAESVAGGVSRLRAMAADIVQRCPDTELGLVGYSQGAHVVSIFAREIGAGDSTVSADKVAAVALFGDPTRGPDAPIFPGAPGKHHPDPAPGTVGVKVATLPKFSLPTPPGEGVGPVRDIAENFGQLTGRVASVCLPGDLACDAPTRAPILHMIVTIAGRAELIPDNPVATLSSIACVLRSAIANTLAAVVDEDVHGYSLGTLSLTPSKPLSIRLAEAADPRVPADPQSRKALLKLATATVNTLIAITGTVLSSSDYADIAGIATRDPLAAIVRLGMAIKSASTRPAPQHDAFRLLTQIFDELGEIGADNAELLDPHVWSHFADTIRRHGGYTHSYGGIRPTTTVLSDWFIALARDLASRKLHLHSGHLTGPAAPGISVGNTPSADSPTTSHGTSAAPHHGRADPAVASPEKPDFADGSRSPRDSYTRRAVLLLLGLTVILISGRGACRLRRANRSSARARRIWPAEQPDRVSSKRSRSPGADESGVDDG